MSLVIDGVVSDIEKKLKQKERLNLITKYKISFFNEKLSIKDLTTNKEVSFQVLINEFIKERYTTLLKKSKVYKKHGYCDNSFNAIITLENGATKEFEICGTYQSSFNTPKKFDDVMNNFYKKLEEFEESVVKNDILYGFKYNPKQNLIDLTTSNYDLLERIKVLEEKIKDKESEIKI